MKEISVRLKGRMIRSPAEKLVPHLKVIAVPPNCSLALLRHEIALAFQLPKKDFDLRVYLDNKKPSDTILDNRTLHRLSSSAGLAIEFDAEKYVFL